MQTKEPELKTAFDDWLARLVCFAFSVSPQALVSQMNRATAEVQKALAEEEGLTPILAWVKALIDDVMATELGAADLEFAWTPTETIDPAVQETILSSYTSEIPIEAFSQTGNLRYAILIDQDILDDHPDRTIDLDDAGNMILR